MLWLKKKWQTSRLILSLAGKSIEGGSRDLVGLPPLIPDWNNAEICKKYLDNQSYHLFDYEKEGYKVRISATSKSEIYKCWSWPCKPLSIADYELAPLRRHKVALRRSLEVCAKASQSRNPRGVSKGAKPLINWKQHKYETVIFIGCQFIWTNREHSGNANNPRHNLVQGEAALTLSSVKTCSKLQYEFTAFLRSACFIIASHIFDRSVKSTSIFQAES